MKKKNRGIVILFTVLALIALGICASVSEKLLHPEDFVSLQRWWLMLIGVGVCFFPLSALIFKRFADKGYFFSKVFGIAIGGWVIWFLSSLHIAKFTATGCFVTLIFCAVVCWASVVFYCRRTKQKLLEFLGITDGSAVVTKALWYEFAFLALFSVLVYLKCFHPQAYGEEKFMDYGFMISMMKSDYMPPEDFWFSGTNLNYYYLTQFFATYLTKLAGVSVDHGYNLALMMTASFCVILVYSLVSAVFRTYMKERANEERSLGKKTIAQFPLAVETYSRIAGALSGLAVAFSSSCHYFVYGRLVPIFREILQIDGSYSYWFPDATRYIGHQREGTGDKTIHEFPAYSFVQGDLHAHVVNISFVLTLLAVLFAWLLWRKNRMKQEVENPSEPENLKAFLMRELLQPHILLLSFLIGIFQMTNYWDFPIYFVVCGAVILVSNAVICGFSGRTVLLTAVHEAEFLIIGFFTSLMFSLRFDIMASGIGICDKHTELYQMIVVWALPICCVFGYLYILIREEAKRKAGEVKPAGHKNAFFAWLQHLKVSELYLLILGLCATGLVLIPEVVYVVDIYSGDFKRANTMFKLTYQAFIMYGIVMGALIVRLLLLGKSAKQRIAGFLVLFLVVENLGYFEKACETWFGEYKNPEYYKTLDASAFLEEVLPMDARAIDWINENIEGRPVILEAPGDSYTDYNRVSAFTGCPTVVGWHTHEWLWKDDVASVDSRGEDVQAIYIGNDPELAKFLLKKYKVDYLYVGHLEYDKYYAKYGFDYDYLRSLGEVVYDYDEGQFYQTFIVKIQYD